MKKTPDELKSAIESLPASFPEYESDDMDRGAQMFKEKVLALCG